MSPQEDTSFPLARQIRATWIGHSHSQWIAWYTRFALGARALSPDQRARLLDYHRSDLEGVLREVRQKQPDLLVEDTRADFAWLVPELEALQPGFLSDYEAIADEPPIRVLRRKSADAALARSECPPQSAGL